MSIIKIMDLFDLFCKKKNTVKKPVLHLSARTIFPRIAFWRRLSRGDLPPRILTPQDTPNTEKSTANSLQISLLMFSVSKLDTSKLYTKL